MSELEPVFEDPRVVLGRHGLRPKRGFSQNFLVSRHAVDEIARAAVPDPAAGTRVIELGPGAGTLTAALLRRGANVIAVEKDRDMIALLSAELSHPHLRVVEGDAATFDLDALGADGWLADGPRPVICGNLPYAITGAILERLVQLAPRIDRAVVMIQREVRDRMLASPGTKTWGALSVYVQARFEVKSVLKVPAGAFHPPPEVDSAVIALIPRPVPIAVEDEALRTIVRAAFGTRRKTLRNGLIREAEGHADALLSEAGIDGSRRGETLSIEELGRLAEGLRARG
jgi:16S rRNA (adenine1518-N6/adenine1519-N6)-dimethyltransferase